MPIIKRAIKKLRHDTKVTERNAKSRLVVRNAVKVARSSPTKKTLSEAFAILDKATKHHIVHANKAARLKSRLTKLLAKK